MEDKGETHIRRGEIIAALSFATDLAMGQPVEFALKSCVLATRIARMQALGAQERAQIYYHSLLRYLGCNADTHTMVALFGDEINFRRDFARIDMARTSEMVGLVFQYLRHANRDAGTLDFIASVVHGLITSQKIAAENIAGHCEVAERLAERLGLTAEVRRNLGQIYERWDGRGLPRGLKGEAVAPAVRVVSFAQDVIVLQAAFGATATKDKLQARRGTAYDPRLLELFLKNTEELTAGLDQTTWDIVLSLEPEPQTPLTEEQFDEACLAMADFADLKSTYSIGHSRAVSLLTKEAARRLGLPEHDAVDLARAGLLHDIGQVAVPARIWQKPAAFNDDDWERVRLHTYYGERILARSAALARLGSIIAQHHERCDGSGYHHGVRGSALSIQGKLLAAAEAYQNKIELRPHRAALTAQAAANALKREAREGRLDGDAVAAVLSAAGHSIPVGKELVAGLTAREVDVLRAVAHGQSMKQIARSLSISPKTVDNHAQSIYSKIGVRTRGGATLFAIEHGLC